MQKLSGKITIKQLVIGVVALAFVLSFASSMISSYQGTLHLLQNQTLKKNESYAMKLTQVVNLFLQHNAHVIEYSASQMVDIMENEALLNAEVDRLFLQNQTFNSVVVVNADGVILAGAPKEADLNGKQIQSKEGLEIIHNQKPIITDPYRASTGNVIITVSHPIFTEEGEYKGAMNGTIYIHDSNFFSSIFDEHEAEDGSYVYVVDSVGRLIYHPDAKRIGEDVSDNEAVKRLIKGEAGSQLTTNTLGIEMLVAYRPLENTKWGIVVQTPESGAVNSVGHQVLKMFYFELPLILLSMFIVIILVWQIVKPLHKIALFAKGSIRESEIENLSKLNAWYYEALQIKNALIQSFTVLHDKVHYFHDQSNIDPLTQLTNRRTLDTVMQQWISKGKPFSIILFDIDHFKKINDTYGHSMGDEVLKYIAIKMKQATRENDICCRYGGEEFVLILPEATKQQAYKIAENLQHLIRQSEGPLPLPITFSAGIATFPKDARTIAELIEVADRALYKAKQTGRNRIMM